MPYQITEPHPTASPNHYMHTGRGGAGNMYKPRSSASAPRQLASLSKVPSHSTSTTKYASGRGGAGNIHDVSSAPVFSFDEEIDFQSSVEKNHDVWHVGRGGAGNWSRSEAGSKSAGNKSSSRKLSNESADSGASSRSGFMGRLSGVFERR